MNVPGVDEQPECSFASGPIGVSASDSQTKLPDVKRMLLDTTSKGATHRMGVEDSSKNPID